MQELGGGPEEDRSELAAAHQQAADALTELSERTVVLRTAERECVRELAALRARAETLAEAARRGADASAALLADPDRFAGVLGSFAARLRVAEGYEVAIAAALGAAAEAIAVTSLDAAAEILSALRRSDAGSAGLVIASAPVRPRSRRPSDDLTALVSAITSAPSATPVTPVTAAPGVTTASDLVRAPAELAQATAELLHGVVVVEDLQQARRIVRDNPALKAVTRTGDLLGAHWAQGGGARRQSLFELRAAADEAAAGLAAAEWACEAAAQDLAAAAEAEEAARQSVAADPDSQARSRRRGGRGLRQAGPAGGCGPGGPGRGGPGRDRHRRGPAGRREGPGQAGAAPGRTGRGRSRGGLAWTRRRTRPTREDLAGRCATARDAEMEARLEVRTAEERLRAISGRADSLTAAAAAERQARERAAQRRARRAEQAAVARAVALGARYAVEAAERSVAEAAERRAEAQAASAGGAGELKAVRARVRDLAADLDTVVNTAHGTEIARAEHRLRLAQLSDHALEEFGIETDALVAEYGPEVPVPVPGDEAAPPITGPSRYDRAEIERRAADAQRQLDRLGKVNPLALEEYAALTERHQFLATQLEDLRKTRRDLLTVVKEVDDRVQEVFASAYADTAREFEQLFSRLFPGGQGNLVLTEPDDMLATGIEIEARPPGKKVKRLSLLSGGERSLTAIAYLFAIFMARPSPFYVLDEVEAALDDTNLQRLLGVFEELRESSQLIVITHQRRTMEAADALYGITMRGDGVSTVISQQIATRQPA